MKRTLTICLLLVSIYGSAQDKGTRASVYSISEDPSSLANSLVASSKTEREKVKVIFRWITDNISYHRPAVVRNRNKKEGKTFSEDDMFQDLPLPSLTERVAKKVLKDRTAVCEGYARLFQSLCHHAGIRCEIISGYARTRAGNSPVGFRSNHNWNAVWIDSSWHLLDVTWASGYLSWSSGEFVRSYDEYYFMTPPEKFIQHHYPDDLRWTLMTDPPAIPEFRHTPFRQKSFNKYGIRDFYPEKGIIETRIGDTIRLEIETDFAERNLSISPDSIWEQESLIPGEAYAYVNPSSSTNAERVHYSFPVASPGVQWLYVMYNNDAILRYRLLIKNEPNSGKVQ